MSEWDGAEDEEPGRRWGRVAAAVAAVIVVLVGVLLAVRATGSDSSTASASSSSAAASSSSATSPRSSVVSTTSSVPRPTVVPSTVAPSTLAPTTTAATTTSSSIAATTSTAAPVTTAIAGDPGASTTVANAGSVPSYSTLPDGSPAPVIAVFDVSQITLTGAVPTQAAKDRLQALAIANSKTPAAVANFLTIDPTVPAGIGVRVVELTSARFDEGSFKVQGQHAQELDRAAAIMKSLPNVTTLVIGHADQIGNAQSNYVLSAQRAKAVVDYLASVDGIDPARMSSRAVGDSDLLTLNDDAASLALNRRTEFVFYGLLTG